MSRPRSNDKNVPISVSIPLSMLQELNFKLSYNQSRSKWIQTAIKNRLNETSSDAITEKSTFILMAVLKERNDIDPLLKIMLQKKVDETFKNQKE